VFVIQEGPRVKPPKSIDPGQKLVRGFLFIDQVIRIGPGHKMIFPFRPDIIEQEPYGQGKPLDRRCQTDHFYHKKHGGLQGIIGMPDDTVKTGSPDPFVRHDPEF
jgi:hypothetical protein